MAKANKPSGGQRLVWRVSAETPLGQIVDASVPPEKMPAPAKSDEPREANWLQSSYDLLNGLEVTESAPGELTEVFLEAPPPAVKVDTGEGHVVGVSKERWILRFAVKLARLQVHVERRQVIGLGKRLWPTNHQLAPEDVAQSVHDRGWEG